MSAVAFLPMYDVRGSRRYSDALWSSLRKAIEARGIEAPKRIDRTMLRLQGWLHPDLVMGQTCGLPYISTLCDKVELIGTPDYGVDGCPPGFYHSTLVVSFRDNRTALAEFQGCTLAVNGKDSQSGYAAIMREASPFARQGRFFGRAVHTGSHARSMQLVAKGVADIAAIDSVTWRMSRKYYLGAAGLKSIGTTEPTPGLPFIAAAGKPAPALLDAAQAGIRSLPARTRQVFGLAGILPFRRQDYEVIKSNLAEAERIHSLPELEEMPT